MKNMMRLMLGAAVVVGGLGLGTTAARAAEFGVYVGGHSAYVPPCPGPGYSWQAGYQNDGYWIPGRWAFVGYGNRDGYRVTRYKGDRDGYRSFRDNDGWRNQNQYRNRDDHRDRGWGNRDDHRDHDRR